MAIHGSEAVLTHPTNDTSALTTTQKADATLNTKECLPCRIMGSGVMAGTGGYAIWQSRAAAPGSPGQKKIVAGLGLGSSDCYFCVLDLQRKCCLALIVGSVFRWRSWK